MPTVSRRAMAARSELPWVGRWLMGGLLCCDQCDVARIVARCSGGSLRGSGVPTFEWLTTGYLMINESLVVDSNGCLLTNG